MRIDRNAPHRDTQCIRVVATSGWSTSKGFGMPSHQIVRMRPAQWAAALQDFLQDCDGSDAPEQASRLEEALALLLRAPVGLAEWQGDLPETAGLAAMIAAGACESAALALLPPEAGYMLSRGGNGVCMASIVLPDSDEDLTSSGQTPALALLSALMLALIGTVAALAPQRGMKFAPQGLRLN